MFENKPFIVFGDIHGRRLWKTIVSDNPACHYIFLGDYLDPYDNFSDKALIDNVLEIVNFKKQNAENVVLLLGNHDLHYFLNYIGRSSRFNWQIASEVRKIFTENITLFQYAYQLENVLFTHAGVSQNWFEKDFQGNINKNIAEQFNNPTDNQLKAMCQCGYARGGAHLHGGIFWADYSELQDELLHHYTQIIGHSQMHKIQKITTENGTVWFCDALARRQYLKISDNLKEFEICKVE